ncbi:hypothetical protein SSS_00532 [Sarcoptes scabiei]|uniref:Uncharacterized protein n=1 Tax=Sarcoptes scabiei TaxID=52283 RepID=A0A834R8D0_SARSC|nr:hypothetical protein SSS_00532 [Sarcoptes scabiei]
MALKTLDYLFELQKQFEGKSDKLIAYYRSKLNEEFYQYKSELAIEPIQLENEGKQTKSITELQNFPGLCPKCWTPLTRKNYHHNIVNVNCLKCTTRFKFKGLTKRTSNQIRSKKNNKNVLVNQWKNSKFIQNSQQQSKASINEKRNQQTPPKFSSMIEAKASLNKLLNSSKKKRNLDQKTRLSDFLEGFL